MKNTKTPTADAGSDEGRVRDVLAYDKRFYARLKEGGDGEYDTIRLRQNLEAPRGDHWLIKLNLKRWRSRAQLSAYLRTAADVVDSLPNKDSATGG